MGKIDKPWGYEIIIEHNEFYVLKKLFMTTNHCCSLQFHDEKHETIYVLNGKMKLVIGESAENLKDIILSEGDYYVIPPKMIHRMCSIDNCTYLEASTNQLDDVIRLIDDYGRE